MKSIRDQFPILNQTVRDGQALVYLDNGATTHKPQSVIDAIRDYYTKQNSNVHRGIHALSEQATEVYEQTRVEIAKYLAASSEREVIFTRGTTEGINLLAHGVGNTRLQKGDRILVTRMEHHSNWVPWQAKANELGCYFDIVELDQDGQIDRQDLKEKLSKKPKIFAFTAISNVLGTVNPVEELASDARDAGAIVVVDAAQWVGHFPLKIDQWPSVDALVFSAHKMYGPTGMGVLWAREELLNLIPPYQYGGSMIESVGDEHSTWAKLPQKFEAGTPHIAGVVGMRSAFEFLSDLNWDQVAHHEQQLLDRLWDRANEFEGKIEFFGPRSRDLKVRVPIMSYAIHGVHPHDVSTYMDSFGVAVRAGHHCAQPLMRHLGKSATTRASLSIYNTTAEVDRWCEVTHELLKFFRKSKS